MTTELKIKDQDVFGALEKFADENTPDVKIENDGIGSYEYWGAKGFDCGSTYPVIDPDLYDLKLDVSDFTEDDLNDLLSALEDEKIAAYSGEIELNREYHRLAGYPSISFEYHFVVTDIKVIGDNGRMYLYLTCTWK